MVDAVRIVGIGGSLRDGSSSLSALQAALDGATKAGASSHLLAVRELDLPLYDPDREVPDSALRFADAAYGADALIWSTPTYHGSVSGSFKNALDWLILLADRDPPYLSNKPIGLVTTAGGVQGLQAINSMDFIVRALRGWAVPLVLPVGQSWQAFSPEGHITDESVTAQLQYIGEEVVRAAHQFRRDGRCDYSDEQQFAGAGTG